MDKIDHLLRAIFRSPVIWGTLGAIGFYSLIFGGPLDIELVRRYFTGHPVEYMETVMFSIGLAALILHAFDILGQRAGLKSSPLGPRSNTPEGIEACNGLLLQLDDLPRRRSNEFFVCRLRDAFEHVRNWGTTDKLYEQMKYISEMDAGRLHAALALFRVILWAIPILGFLGTVVGITMALNAVDLKSPDQSMLKVLNGLGLKFDTTALALTLSMALMFVYFFVDRLSNGFLEQLDRRVEEELAGRISGLSAPADGQSLAMRRMAETMIQASERLVQRQAEIWQGSLQTASAHWTQMAKSNGEQVRRSLSAALDESLKNLARNLTAAEGAFIQSTRQHCENIVQTQTQGSRELAVLQTAVTRQTEVLQQTFSAMGEVARLEDALNRNLGALAGAKHFEQTVMSLAAAINLLNARLAEMPAQAPIKLDPSRRAASQAA
ncbi:MAG: MotA/TolQ/ExbB proton channel family protein [Thermoguttaceae bacterium]